MNFFTSLFLAACLINLASSRTEKPTMVIEIFKNGAAYPSAENDPFVFPFNDQITPIGLRQQYNLGSLISRKYGHLLTTTNSSVVYMRSLRAKTSIDSMYGQMFGIFQGKSSILPSALPKADTIPPFMLKQESRDELVQELGDNSQSIPKGFQPTNIESKPLAEEDMLDIRPENCLYVKGKQAQRENSTLVSKVFAYLNESVATLNKLGYNISNMESLAQLGRAVSTMYVEGRNQELLEEMRYGTVVYNDSVFASQWYSTYLLTGETEEMSLKSVNLLQKVSDLTLGSVRKSHDYKFAFFSGQDSTLLPLLGLYKIVNDTCLLDNYKNQKQNKSLAYPDCNYPREGSQIIYELYNTHGLAHVRFLYNGKPFKVCTSETADECNLSAFLQETKNLVNKMTRRDYKSFCTLGYKQAGIYISWPVEVVVVIPSGVHLLSVISAVMLVLVFFSVYKLKSKKKQWNQMKDEPEPSVEVVTG